MKKNQITKGWSNGECNSVRWNLSIFPGTEIVLTILRVKSGTDSGKWRGLVNIDGNPHIAHQAFNSPLSGLKFGMRKINKLTRKHTLRPIQMEIERLNGNLEIIDHFPKELASEKIFIDKNTLVLGMLLEGEL